MASSIYQHLNSLLSSGQSIAMATITDVKGSVPREVWAKMIIHPLGQHVGTIGGGCGEADVIRIGLDVIQDGQPQNVYVDLTEDINMQSLGVCGGTMNVYIERWPRSDPERWPRRKLATSTGAEIHVDSEGTASE